MFRAAGFGFPLLLAASLPAQSPEIAITGVTVIDGTAPAPRLDQTVLIRGNRIAAVGPSRSIAVPRGARVIAGGGRYLIPGLWDMHVHTDVPAGEAVLGLYLARGVLGVRDLAGDWERISRWRREIAAGRLAGPRIMASGPYLEGGDVPIPHILARNPEEARRAVDSLARLGVDVVKLHSQLTRDAYLAAASEARRRGLRVAGHVPRSVGAALASDSGVGSLEHLLQIPIPCTPAESIRLVPRFPIQRVLGECSSADPGPLFARFVANRTWVVPTLTASVEIARWPRRELPGDTVSAFLPDTLEHFVAGIFPMPADVPPGADTIGAVLFEKRLELVGLMHRAGVLILPGTDAPLRNSPPGFGLHGELVLLVQAGFTLFEALRAATLLPARYFGIDSLGAIAPGYLADLVLLEADPLADIANTARIAAVLANGRWYGDAEIRRLLTAAGSAP